MLINFYEHVRNVASVEHKKCPHTMNAIEARKFVKSFSKEQQARLAYHFERWEWDTDILGEYKGYELAWEYANIFTAFVSKYRESRQTVFRESNRKKRFGLEREKIKTKRRKKL